MAKRKKKVVAEYKPTKRQLSHLKKQRRRQRIILIAGIAVISVVLVLVAVGVFYQWYQPEYKPLHQTVLEVNGKKFNMDYYVKALKYYSGGQPYYAQYMVDSVADYIEQDELIRQQALELGYSVSGSEVKREIEDKDLPDNPAVRDIVEAHLLVNQLKEDYFGPQVPLSAEHRYVLAMFLESESLAAALRDRIAAGEDFTELAAEFSLDGFTKEKSGDLGWRPRGILDGLLFSTVIDDAVFSASVEVLSQPLYDEEKGKGLGYWLIEVLEKKEDSQEVHVRAMLLASEEEALSIKDRIAAGEDFAQLAAEFSQLDGAGEDGGDLGFVTRGTWGATFEDYAFDPETELNTISEPIADETVTSRGGCWLFVVSEIDPGRPLSDEDRELLLSSLLGDWVSSLVEDPQNEVVNYLDDEMRAFAVTRVIGS